MTHSSQPRSMEADPTAQPRWLGKRVGRFRLVSLIGKGAYGRVFLAEDVDLQRRVALKVISADATAKSAKAAGAETMDSESLKEAARQAVERMIREARAAARIEHPNVVQIYEVGKVEGMGLGGFIAMELLEGGTLQELLRAAGPMDVARACSLVGDAAEALQFAHEMGVVHRDVKPGNLMLSRQGRCKVADFGLAWVDDPQDGGHQMPIAGTAHYMAPEVIYGSLPDPKSDQYSLAAATFTLLTGRPPYTGADRRQVLEAHVSSPVPDLLDFRPDVDARLSEVIQRAMAKDPADRFPTIRQFGTALRLFTVPVGAGMMPLGLGSGIPDVSLSTGSAAASMSASSFGGSLGLGAGADPLHQAARHGTPPAARSAPAAKKQSLLPWVALAVGPLLLLVIVVVVVQLSGGDGDDDAGSQRVAQTNPAVQADQAQTTPRPPGNTPSPAAMTLYEDFDTITGHFSGFPEDKVKGSLTRLPDAGNNGAVRMRWTFTDPNTTEAAYLRLERQLPHDARRLEVRVRAAEGEPPARVLLKVAVKDHKGERPLLTLHDGLLPTDWRTYSVALPPGLTPPLQWQDVYVVRTGTAYSATGALDIDELHVYPSAR